MPKVKLFALKIHHEYQEQVSLALAIAIAKNHWPLYQEWVTQNSLLFNKKPLPISLVTREFEFQGFKPVRADKRKPFTLELDRCIESLGFNLKYAFITSNQILEGYIWVYPEEFANDYSDLNKMISKIKESDLSSEKKLSRKAEATKFVEIIKTEWNAQLKSYDLDHNLINQIEANWKEPLNIALHKYHYQKERG